MEVALALPVGLHLLRKIDCSESDISGKFGQYGRV